MEQNLENKRKSHIDLMEFIGIFMVIIYHSFRYPLDFFSNSEYYINYFFNSILSICVPLFFFANGYLILNRKFDLKKHINKSIKLVILTIVWEIIGLFLIMHIENKELTIKEFILDCWKMEPIGWINHLWFMTALICVYVFFPLIKNVYDNNRNIFIYFLVICFIFSFLNILLSEVATIIANVFFHKDKIYVINFFREFNPLRGLHGYSFVYFCLGGLMYNYEEKILSSSDCKRNVISVIGVLISSICLGLLGVYYSKISGKYWDLVFDGYSTIFTLLNVIFVYVLSLNYKKNNKFIYYVSCNTLGIYFIHNIIIHLLGKTMFLQSIRNTLLGSIVFAFIILSICLIITFVMKKIPIVKKLVS